MSEPVTSDQQIWIASAGSRGSSTIEFLLLRNARSGADRCIWGVDDNVAAPEVGEGLAKAIHYRLNLVTPLA